MKKILLFTDCLCSGGAQRQLVGLADLLNQKGYHVKVCYYYDIPFFKSFLEEKDIEHELIAGASNTKRRILIVTKYLKKENPDCVIAYQETPSIVACLAKLFGGKFRLIVSERNTTQQMGINEHVRFFLYRWADVIVPNNYSQEKFLLTHYPLMKKKIKVITNFVDTNFYVPTEIENARHVKRILILGRIAPQKNVLRFIDAIEVVSKEFDIQVDWYGRPESASYYDLCQKRAMELNIDHVFSFYEPTKNVINELQSSDLLCLPSLFEGFPNVVGEALSCGLPVVCSDVCDNPILVENGITGFRFNPYDIESMAKGIKSFLYLTESEKNKMKENARKKALMLLSSSSFISKYESVIKK